MIQSTVCMKMIISFSVYAITLRNWLRNGPRMTLNDRLRSIRKLRWPFRSIFVNNNRMPCLNNITFPIRLLNLSIFLIPIHMITILMKHRQSPLINPHIFQQQINLHSPFSFHRSQYLNSLPQITIPNPSHHLTQPLQIN